MNRDDEILTAIRQKDVGTIIAAIFSKDYTKIRPNYQTETTLWDYKLLCPLPSAPALEWAEISKDVLAFHNTGKGGLLIFGVRNNVFAVEGCSSVHSLDSKLFNDRIRKYVGDKLWVEFYALDNSEKTISIGIAIIPPLQEHLAIQRFQKNGPEKNKKLLFSANGSAIRKNDSSIVMSPIEANTYELSKPTILYREYDVDEPYYRLLSADYHEFISREKYCREILKGLHHGRAASVSLIGIGGVGKTALATWAVKTAYENNEFDYIISISAKDRELTTSGIRSIAQKMTSLDDLLNEILDVIGFVDEKALSTEKKRAVVQDLLSGEKVLLFIDNLETAINTDIISFLNDLPEPVKAIITSRRNVVTISSYPIEIGPLEDSEIERYITSLSELDEFAYCRSLSIQEKERIGRAFNGIPLAIKWIIGKCRTSDELVSEAEKMANCGKSSEELLEFSFRRVFDNMNTVEKQIMQVLAIVSDLPIEALLQGTRMKQRSGEVFDAIDSLSRDTIIIKYYDAETRAYKYRLLSIVQKFMLNNCIKPDDERGIQRRLSYWYNAEDIGDPEERQLVSAMRQGGLNMGNTLVSFAETAAKKDDNDTAIRFFEAATSRDPQNWRVYWRYGEYFRHVEGSTAKAISQYETAIRLSSSVKSNSEVATMHREFGILYGRSGRPDATKRAVEHLAIAYEGMPHDPVCARKYSEYLFRQGKYEKVIQILQPFSKTTKKTERETLLPLLLTTYEKNHTKYMKEIADLKNNGIQPE